MSHVLLSHLGEAEVKISNLSPRVRGGRREEEEEEMEREGDCFLEEEEVRRDVAVLSEATACAMFSCALITLALTRWYRGKDWTSKWWLRAYSRDCMLSLGLPWCRLIWAIIRGRGWSWGSSPDSAG